MTRVVLCFVAFLLLLQPASPRAAAAPSGVSSSRDVVETNAEAAALIDVASGRILYSKQGDKRMRIASTTKIMTAILAIEHGHLSDKVTVSKNAFGKEGSSIYLKLGEEMSLSDLLYGLMLRSGNDAATAISEHVGGSQDGFVFLMNRKAEELGMTGSHFSNPSGLDGDDHYSTANDMAKLTAYALKNPIFREIVKTKAKRISREDESWDTVWNNKNKMLALYPGSDGVKTGFTKLSRRCLVSSATRNGQQLAAVTLNDGSDWADHSRMLDYGFKNYPLELVVHKGEPFPNGYQAAKDFAYPLADGERETLRKAVVSVPRSSVAYRLGEIAYLSVKLDGDRIGRISLESAEAKETSMRETGLIRTWIEAFGKVLSSLIPG